MRVVMRKTTSGFIVIVLAWMACLIAPEMTEATLMHGQDAAPRVRLIRTPDGGIQPQAVMDSHGTLHLIYFTGNANAGDVYYVRRESGKESFSNPLRVNSQPGSVIATGTIRGAHLAIGRGGRAHVSWMGSQTAEPKGPAGATPMLYSRLNNAKTGFEAQRNVMQFAVGLDGGGSVAADEEGNVYVAWHGRGDKEGESDRRVWIARSRDEGQTFAKEAPAYSERTGACGCCGMRAFASSRGTVHLLYRAATDFVNRDMYLLSSTDRGQEFRGLRLDEWKLDTCPMSSAFMTEVSGEVLAAWETAGQIFFAKMNSNGLRPANLASAPGQGTGRKHPVVAANDKGEMILVWTEGTGWKKGGSLAWQVFDRSGKPLGEVGARDGVPVWSVPAAIASPGAGFTIIY